MLDKKELQEIVAQQVREIAKERLQSAINSLQRAMYELERYAEKFDEAEDNLERAKVLNYSINHLVCNIQPNLRIDLLAHSQAELSKFGA